MNIRLNIVFIKGRRRLECLLFEVLFFYENETLKVNGVFFALFAAGE